VEKIMAYVRRYKDMDTNIDDLYKSIVTELSNSKEMNVVNELKGKANDKNFKSVTATRTTIPRAFVGDLWEVTVTITDDPDDFIVEAHIDAWLSNLAMSGAGGFLIAGPIGAGVGAGASDIVAVDYQRKLGKHIRDLVNQHSSKELNINNIESFS
jgi:hypothetical protein